MLLCVQQNKKRKAVDKMTVRMVHEKDSMKILYKRRAILSADTV